jgi:hypothetical protein
LRDSEQEAKVQIIIYIKNQISGSDQSDHQPALAEEVFDTYVYPIATRQALGNIYSTMLGGVLNTKGLL